MRIFFSFPAISIWAVQVLLAPSVYPEAFGLVVAEAQLRGIPVVSTAICGLMEANQVPQMQVPDIPIVFDPSSLVEADVFTCFYCMSLFFFQLLKSIFFLLFFD